MDSLAFDQEADEKRFFKMQSELNLLAHSAKLLQRFQMEGQYSTASSYEDALKILVKYQMKLARQEDQVTQCFCMDCPLRTSYV